MILVSETLMKAIINSSILLIGILILSNTKYKKFILTIGYLASIVISSYTFNFGFQVGIGSLALFILMYSRLTQDSWRYTLFLITNVVSIAVVSKYWSNFLALLVISNFNILSDFYLETSLVLQLFISFGIYRVLMRIFKGIGVHLFLNTLGLEYQRILTFALVFVQVFYVLISFVPDFYNENLQFVVTVQTLYTTVLAIMMLVLLVLFRYLVKNKIDLQERSATLEHVEQSITVFEMELKEKERLIKLMDEQVSTLSDTRRKLMDFEHDQLNFIIALEGGIRSGDMKVMQDSLEQYGTAVQEVLELKNDTIVLNNLDDSGLMPVRYLILAKSRLAISQGIKFTLEVPTNITNVGIDMKDFVRIIGIWLDNALEEVIHVDDKWIHMSFLQDFDEDEDISILEMRVSNSCRPKKQEDIVKLHDQGYSSKEGENRGNGLRIVNDIMFKHENIHISTIVKVADTKFTQLLSIALPK